MSTSNQTPELKPQMDSVLSPTSEGHESPRVGVHLGVSRPPHLADVVAHRVAATLAAVEAHAAVEHLAAAAAVGLGRLAFVQQGVDEQVHRALVLALDGVCDGCGRSVGRRHSFNGQEPHWMDGREAAVLAAATRLILSLTLVCSNLRPSVYFQSDMNGLIVRHDSSEAASGRRLLTGARRWSEVDAAGRVVLSASSMGSRDPSVLLLWEVLSVTIDRKAVFEICKK